MTIWDGETRELDKLYSAFKGSLPDIMKEMEQLLKTDDPNVVMLYSRRCLELIITDLCECELKRPRKTEPLKGILDKLNAEEKVPSYIITSMLSLNSMANYGAHPKDFDPEQVKPVLNNLSIIIKWYLKYKDFKVVSKTEDAEVKAEEKADDILQQPVTKNQPATRKRLSRAIAIPVFIIIIVILGWFLFRLIETSPKVKFPPIDFINTPSFVDNRDNEIYHYVKIDNQYWFAENLRAIKLNDGTPIPLVKDNKEWENLQTPAYCWYDNDKRAFGSAYGPLYNWFAVNTGKLCPAGWHVPSDEEWTQLTKYVGDSIDWVTRGIAPSDGIAGNKLKEAGFKHWSYQDSLKATDEFGFRALPGGYRTIYGISFAIGFQGSWWSSSENKYDPRDGYNREMYLNSSGVTRIEQYKQTGMSVRCVKD